MHTGPGFREEHELDDGTRILLRHIQPSDADALRRGFERLSFDSRYRRFQAGVGSLSDATLRYLTQVDGRDHVALVATTRPTDGSEPVGLGVGRFVRLRDDPSVAEVAVTVVDDAQHKGLGRILAIALARAAHERGITRFRGQILADNAPVMALLDEASAVVHDGADNQAVFDVDLER